MRFKSLDPLGTFEEVPFNLPVKGQCCYVFISLLYSSSEQELSLVWHVELPAQ